MKNGPRRLLGPRRIVRPASADVEQVIRLLPVPVPLDPPDDAVRLLPRGVDALAVGAARRGDGLDDGAADADAKGAVIQYVVVAFAAEVPEADQLPAGGIRTQDRVAVVRVDAPSVLLVEEQHRAEAVSAVRWR